MRSMLTFHAYLGENSAADVGGATRFFVRSRGDAEIDVAPVQGRVLVFQHRNLVHSGEEMVEGLKHTLRTDIMYERLPEEGDEEAESAEGA